MISRILPLALAAASGVSAWLSLSALAVVDASSRARVGVLAPWWMLALLVAMAVAVASAARLSTARALPLGLSVLLWLPWLPGPVPASFLIWTGPVIGLVWTAAGLGLAAPALRRIAGWPWSHDARRAPVAAAAIAASIYLAGAVLLQTRIPAGDEPHYLVISDSLLRDGDLRIENNHARGDYFAYYPSELRPDFLQRGQDGQIYSVHAPGVSALVLPAFAVAGYAGAVATMAALVAVGLALLWTAAWRLTGSTAAAWAGWSSVALTAPVVFHGFTIYPDGAGAACTAAGLWLLVALEQRRAVRAPALVAVGTALAALPWLHTRFVLIAAVLGAALTLRLAANRTSSEAGVPASRGTRVATFLAVPALSAATWFAYFWIIWGTPSPAAPYGHYTQSAVRQLWPGVPGLLVDQQFGLVANAPIYLAAIAGVLPLARRHPRLAIELVLVAVPYALAVASYRMWWGGYSAPARFLVAALPAAVLPVAVLWQRSGAALRAAALALLTVSLLIILPRVLVDEGVLTYNARDGFDLLLDWANRTVNLPLAWPSLHRDVVPDALRDVAAWVAAAAVCGAPLLWLGSRADSVWAGAAAGLAGASMVAATLVWQRHGLAAVTPEASELDLLHRLRPGWHEIAWQSRPWRMVSVDEVLGRLDLATVTRGPKPDGRPPLFTAPFLPAGRYEIGVAGATRPSGRLTASVGRTEQIVDAWSLDGRPGGFTGLVVHLPVRVHSLTIRGDDTARAAVSRVTLRPHVSADWTALDVRRLARRASRYGNARVFFLDDNAFMEPPGFWTRGKAATGLVIDADGRVPAALNFRAGAVATDATISSGAWSESVSLAPGETRSITLPALDDADGWVVRIETATGFRPAQHDPSSKDLRNLGVWVAVP